MVIKNKLAKLLTEIGLGEAEIKVYLALLNRPAKTIWELKSRTGLSKSNTYRSFDRLRHLKMVDNGKAGICALSLKNLVAQLGSKERDLRKNVRKLKELSPFLKTPQEPIEVFETMYTPEQIRQAYMFMSQTDYDTNLELGDFENFAEVLGTIQVPLSFRRERAKHAVNHSICTTFGKNTAYFTTKEMAQRYQCHVDISPIDLGKKYIILADTSDYVLFNHFEDLDNPYSVLIKSKVIADAQRAQFKAFSQKFGN